MFEFSNTNSRMSWCLAGLAAREGLWLNDKNAVIGLSRLNPLPKDSAVNKSLAKAILGVGTALMRRSCAVDRH